MEVNTVPLRVSVLERLDVPVELMRVTIKMELVDALLMISAEEIDSVTLMVGARDKRTADDIYGSKIGRAHV